MRWCQLSNCSLLFPALYAAYKDMRWASAALVLSMLLSVFYHCDEKNEFALLADIVGCSVVSSCIFYLVLNSSPFTRWNVLALVYLCAALTCFALAGPTDDDAYDSIHAAWHVFAAYGILAFVHGFNPSPTITTATVHAAGAATRCPGRFQTEDAGGDRPDVERHEIVLATEETHGGLKLAPSGREHPVSESNRRIAEHMRRNNGSKVITKPSQGITRRDRDIRKVERGQIVSCVVGHA